MLPFNFFIPVWFTPQQERDSLRPASFLLNPLKYKHLAVLQASLILKEGNELSIPTQDIILQDCVVDVFNVDTDMPISLLVKELPLKLKQELVDTLIKYFYITQEDKKKIQQAIDFTLSDRFSDDTWQCENCQKKGLDKQRNCPLLPKEEQDKYYNPLFSIPLGGEKLYQCPIGLIDHHLVVAINEAYGFLSKSILPEKGGMGDQTLFFGYASQAMHRAVEKYKAEQLKDAGSDSKS